MNRFHININIILANLVLILGHVVAFHTNSVHLNRISIEPKTLTTTTRKWGISLQHHSKKNVNNNHDEEEGKEGTESKSIIMSNNNEWLTRRDVATKTTLLTTSTLLTTTSFHPSPTFAADGEKEEEEEEGRLIEFKVENLNGEPGKSGTILIRTKPSWSPNGVKRFEKLTSVGFWNDARIFRVIPKFIAQFGINGNPTTQALWRSNIPDDPVKVSNRRGTVVFATAGPNTRTTQIFINMNDNAFLDRQGFSPIGEIVEGMDVVESLYAGYGEGAPQGKGPNQGLIQAKGNEYLEKSYPKLSYFSKADFK